MGLGVLLDLISLVRMVDSKPNQMFMAYINLAWVYMSVETTPAPIVRVVSRANPALLLGTNRGSGWIQKYRRCITFLF